MIIPLLTPPHPSYLHQKSLHSFIYMSVFHSGSDGKEICLQCKRPGFNLEVREIPWRRERYPLPYSYLENPMDRGAWLTIVHRITKSQT